MSDEKTDIVERLRGAATAECGCDCDKCKAADEIERLRAKKVELQSEIELLRAGGCARDQRATQYCAEAVALQSEVERLLAELEKERRETRHWIAEWKRLDVEVSDLKAARSRRVESALNATVRSGQCVVIARPEALMRFPELADILRPVAEKDGGGA